MEAQRLLVAVGAGFTTVVLVAGLVIELLAFEFSSIVGLPVGLLAGLAVLIGIGVVFDDLNVGVRRAVAGYATFGIALFAQLVARYVDLGDSRALLSVPVMIGVSLLAAAIGCWLLGTPGSSN